MLAKFRDAKQKEIRQLRKLAEEGKFPAYYRGPLPLFSETLREKAEPMAIIAEYKRASPSKGLICQCLNVEDVAKDYTSAQAGALSILTEKTYFDGEFEFLARARSASELPILRKDFIFDPIQVEHSASAPVSALLLITRMFNSARELRDLREQAEDLSRECVVEVFDDQDLRMARDSGATIIQVNARDLDKLQVDRQACLDLIGRSRPQGNEIWIAASGMESAQHLHQATEAGYTAALLGTALMKDGAPGRTLKNLQSEFRNLYY